MTLDFGMLLEALALVVLLIASRLGRKELRAVVAEVVSENLAAQSKAVRAAVREELGDQVRAAVRAEMAEPLGEVRELRGKVQTLEAWMTAHVRGDPQPAHQAPQGPKPPAEDSRAEVLTRP